MEFAGIVTNAAVIAVVGWLLNGRIDRLERRIDGLEGGSPRSGRR